VTEMVSFGAGVNSVAMTIMLVNDGWRGPIVFADTGGEHPETYCHMRYFEDEFLKPRGLEITRLEPGTPYHDTMSQVPLEEYCLKAGVIPLMAVRWCTSRWKGRPIDRWARDQGINIQFLGIAADEARRASGKAKWLEFPLIDEGINRQECLNIIARARLEQPYKSSCFFCPGQTIGEWRRLYDTQPDLFERARQMEINASVRYDKRATLNYHLSLDEMVVRGWDIQMQMDLSRWLPCLCSL